MKLAVNPNRMELLKLRRRLVIAQHGHKLLEDKQDELMRKFLNLVSECQKSRQGIDKSLIEVFKRFLIARSIMSEDEMEKSLASAKKMIILAISTTRLMNLNIPHLEIDQMPEVFGYNFLTTSGELDIAFKNFLQLLPQLIKLAELEKTIEILAEELERTRRRVNALEYVFIPAIGETIRYIADKLSEMERANLTRLMRVKEIVRSH
jgi:V/A-type H+-transporting ATPase subunit D